METRQRIHAGPGLVLPLPLPQALVLCHNWTCRNGTCPGTGEGEGVWVSRMVGARFES